DNKLSVSRQCELLALARSTFYRILVEIPQSEIALMEWIDLCHLEHPCYGTRRIRDWLEDRGLNVNRKRVRRLKRKLAIEARYPKKRLSRPGKGHQIYPYLLRDVIISHPDHVWATDITYIPMAKALVYLVAILDLYSRRVLAWRLSNTMDVSFCIEALEEALERYGPPEIFNSDQGSQFT
ncbi:MAG: IS3 family transposase, partial [Myxococcales bacterium]|nr:IS3 family transposase [Myxococcales bacterium]